MSFPMPYDERKISTVFAPADDRREMERAQARDRVLLYLRGLGVRAQPSLQLAMETMRRSGPDADLSAIMHEMHVLLREHGVDLRVADCEGQPLKSSAPMNRRSMLSGDMSRPTMRGWMRGLIGKVGA